jgi:MOSC domain-containing protein YiiM
LEQHIETTNIQQVLDELGASPQDNGTVELIVARPHLGERRVLEVAEFNTSEGLVGDNWLTRGSRHTTDGQSNPDVQVAVMNSRTIQAIAGDTDKSKWAMAGDQLYLDIDISAGNLPVGQQIAIGTVILEVTEVPHNGCGKFTERFGSDATRFVNSREGRENRRRGVNMRVVQGGTIRTGDSVVKHSS